MKCSDYDKILKCLLNAKGFVNFLKTQFDEFDCFDLFNVGLDTYETVHHLGIALENDISRFKENNKRGE